LLAYPYAQTGRTDNAVHALAADGFRDIPHDGIWLGAITCLAETCAATGSDRQAATLYGLLAPYADRNVVIGSASTCAGPAARHLGLLASVLGRHETAAGHFEQAIAMNHAMGARPWMARTRLQYAQALRTDSHSGTSNVLYPCSTTRSPPPSSRPRRQYHHHIDPDVHTLGNRTDVGVLARAGSCRAGVIGARSVVGGREHDRQLSAIEQVNSTEGRRAPTRAGTEPRASPPRPH
jgi:hypothetical protein